jgi:hypothetical protein
MSFLIVKVTLAQAAKLDGSLEPFFVAAEFLQNE